MQLQSKFQTPCADKCRGVQLSVRRVAPRSVRRSVITKAFSPADAVGLGLFFAPGLGILAYSAVKGKGNVKDGFSRLITEVSQGYFQPNVGGENIPVAQGELSDLAGDDPLFKALYKWFIESGGVFKLEFGPKAFIVVSDPVVAKHILKDNVFNYDKGVLAEILEPIMGKGLIPADLVTWKSSRRAVVPGFHKAYLEAMVQMFGRCTQQTVDKLQAATRQGPAQVDMETEFLNLGLDIIGLGVFNYQFGSITRESPVIKSVYGVLKEAEHRSTFYLPYWNLPFARYVVPRQRQFHADLAVINDCLNELIRQAKNTSQLEDLEALQARDYSAVQDPSLLRFLVDLRGADLSAQQLRDDLMTMLIAGHETTAAVLTWALYSVATNAEIEAKLMQEIDSVLGDKTPDWSDVMRMPYTRLVLAESLRMYPQPPILIRRALGEDTLPAGYKGVPGGYPIGKGADIFISVWNLHRSPYLWKDPDVFRPERFMEPNSNADFPEWEGFKPELMGSSMYPNEVASDFGFIPFGGGARKCIGDQFAFLEATVAFSMVLRKFQFRLTDGRDSVGMATGATIHTANGLKMTVTGRQPQHQAASQSSAPKQPVAA